MVVYVVGPDVQLVQRKIELKMHGRMDQFIRVGAGETFPDIWEEKGLATLYHVNLDELIEYDFDQTRVQEMIDSVSGEVEEKIDWNRVWSKKYPVLSTYHKTMRMEEYAPVLGEMLSQLQVDYGFSHTDAALVLKDILARAWKGQL